MRMRILQALVIITDSIICGPVNHTRKRKNGTVCSIRKLFVPTLKVDGKSLNIADVTYGKFNDYIRVNGQVQPIFVVQLSPEEGGIVQEKVVEEGAHVKKGDVILRLSNSNLDLQILNAESELAEKQNLLRNTQVTMQQDKLNNETEKVQLDIDTRRKQRTFQQYQRLYKERLISREEYLQAKEDYEVAQKKHKLITERLVQDSIYRNIQMDQMEDNLQNMRKNVLLISERKDKLEVRATIDGELGLLDAEVRQNITAGQMVGQINDLSDFKIEAMIDGEEQHRAEVKVIAHASRLVVDDRMRLSHSLCHLIMVGINHARFRCG